MVCLVNQWIDDTAISENTEIFDGNYPSIPIFGPIVENTDFWGIIWRKYRFFVCTLAKIPGFAQQICDFTDFRRVIWRSDRENCPKYRFSGCILVIRTEFWE